MKIGIVLFIVGAILLIINNENNPTFIIITNICVIIGFICIALSILNRKT
jgi:membrane-bound ClpP family serine protease